MARHKFINVRLNEDEREQLLQMAKAWGVRRSEVLRFAFRAFLLGSQKRNLDTGKAASKQATKQLERV
jgi:hypothetical protein